jgi:hypothetical protein
MDPALTPESHLERFAAQWRSKPLVGGIQAAKRDVGVHKKTGRE